MLTRYLTWKAISRHKDYTRILNFVDIFLQYLFNSVIHGSDQEHTASHNRVQWLLYKISSHENLKQIFNLLTKHCKPAANQLDGK